MLEQATTTAMATAGVAIETNQYNNNYANVNSTAGFLQPQCTAVVAVVADICMYVAVMEQHVA